MTVRLEASVLQVELEDDAAPFDPTAVPRPDIATPIRARPIGGLEVHLVRETMDGFAYRRVAGRNIVTQTKQARGGGAAGPQDRRNELE